MADFVKIIPHLLLWEVGYKVKPGQSPEEAYAAAARKGYHNIPGDKGGPTMCGVTLATYSGWCRSHGLPCPTAQTLARMPYAQWVEIARGQFWERYRADAIANQSVAEMFVDWAWTSGAGGVKAAQRALGLTADGVVGPKTVARLNAPESEGTWRTLRDARLRFYAACAAKPGQAKFGKGWRNRVTSMTFRP